MSNFYEWITDYFCNSLWQVPLFVLSAWLVERIVRRLGPSVKHGLWIGALVVAVLAPAWGATVHLLSAQDQTVDSTRFVLKSGASVSGMSGAVGAGETFHLPPNFYYVLLLGYLITCALRGARLGRSMYRIHLLKCQAEPAGQVGDAARHWALSQRDFSIVQTRLAFSSTVAVPLTVGWRTALVLVPFSFFDEVKQEDIRAALGHECAHVERNDFAWNLFYELLLIPLAYHPAAWLLRARIAESREQVCDAMAAARMNGAAAYARSLLRLAAHFCARPTVLPAAMLGLFENNEMEKRIMNLTEKKRHYSLSKRLLLLAPGVGLMALACVASCVLAFNVEVPAYGASYSQAAALPASDSGESGLPPTDLSKLQKYSAANGSRMKVYKVGGGVSAPIALNSVEASYSAEARRMKYQGTCLIAVVVDAQGNPRNPQVIRELGMGLDKKALEAVRKYKFKPAIKDGKRSVPVIITVEVGFRLY